MIAKWGLLFNHVSMILLIEIPFKPLTINQAKTRSRNGTIIKTQAYRKFESDVSAYLMQFYAEFRNLKTDHDKRKCAVKVTYNVYCPKDEYYTKKGQMSLTRGDNDNYGKCLTDVLFKSIGINDAYLNPAPIIYVIPKDRWTVLAEIELIPHPSPEEFSN